MTITKKDISDHIMVSTGLSASDCMALTNALFDTPRWPVKIPRLWSLQNPPPEARLTVQ